MHLIFRNLIKYQEVKKDYHKVLKEYKKYIQNAIEQSRTKVAQGYYLERKISYSSNEKFKYEGVNLFNFVMNEIQHYDREISYNVYIKFKKFI